MKQQEFTRHFGTQYKAEIELKQTINFKDQEAVLALLRKYNLLSKTLVPTQSTIAALLQDVDVPADVKESLKQLATTSVEENLHLEKTE